MTAANTIPAALKELGEATAVEIAAHLGVSKALVRRHLANMRCKPLGDPHRAVVIEWQGPPGCTKPTGLWALSLTAVSKPLPGPAPRKKPVYRPPVVRRGPDWSLISAWHPSVSRFVPHISQVMP